tara:strand:- start:144 stop:467 length:324 start_codon:yes stop_codon:yes gene_type:complete
MSSHVTVASFLREKAGNMVAWLGENGYEGGLKMPQLTDLALVAMCQTLHSKYRTAIEQRDFAWLWSNKENAPHDLMRVVAFVEANDVLHDKFWRYLKLFSDTVSSDE